ncbi:MFS transporter [Clostridium sp. A1-XYC3]|uniref:Lysosomal dipeptide transporter MFSD1 n=1 Tax=Clostridium tanneri TaxID=3037988 RepID=A0ABU4JYX9_9CLOT|nr:MFS transporter [Clostridium sp. A1-XYC3]MDW8803121.1 MFS transporter [Clostridium sp. A1-XYC3]
MENKKTKNYAWVILIVACLAIFSPSYTQYQLSPIYKDLITKFSLSNSQFTSVFSAPMIPAVFLSLIAGLLVDRFGVKVVITVALTISAIGTTLRITAGTYSILFISMLMAGFGATFLNANGAKILCGWFPTEKVSMVMGVFLAASNIGMTIGMGTTAMIPSISNAFFIAAVISIIVVIIWIIFMKNPSCSIGDKPDALPIGECLKVVVKSRPVWIVGLCLMFILGANIVVSSFLPAALISRGISAVSAGVYASMVAIGSLIGCILAPAVALKLKNAKLLLFSLSITSAIFVIFSWKMPEGLLLGICLLTTGVTIGGLMPLLMSIPIRLKEIGPTYAGTAGGFTGTIQLLGAVIIPTYIVVPLSGNNTNMLFVLGGICMVLVCIVCLALPNLDKQ